MITLLIATRNAHKAGEIHAILGGGFRLLTLTDFPTAPTVVEDAPTFAGNATKKAVELAKWLAGSQPSTLNLQPLFVLADDSGLEVDALNGAPGVHSARFAAADSAKSGNTPDADNNAKLLRLLEDVPVEKRTARFHCVLALVPTGAASSLSRPAVISRAGSSAASPHQNFSMACAKAGSFSRRAGKTASATTRCLCRPVLSRALPNWAMRRKTG